MDINEYIEQHSSAEPDYLQRISRSTYLNVLNPHMLSGHIQGRVLSMLSQMIAPKRILELGTYTGYSALCLAEGLTHDGKLITIDHNDELESTIRENLSLSPLGEKIELVIADANTYLPTLLQETVANDTPHLPSSEQESFFDLVFIDADKREYCTYLDLVRPLVRPGGWILADNTLWDGHVIDPAYDKEKQTLGLRAFNHCVAQDPTLQKVILPLRDGLTLIRVI